MDNGSSSGIPKRPRIDNKLFMKRNCSGQFSKKKDYFEEAITMPPETVTVNSIRRKSRKSFDSPDIVVVDSGAYTIKVGNVYDKEPSIVPNCIMKAKSERKRTFIGDRIDDCRDLSGLYYQLPCEKGYVVKWDTQKSIWDHVVKPYLTEESTVITTQPIQNFRESQEAADEIFFEEYDVKALYRAYPSDYIYYDYAKNIKKGVTNCIIVDTGYSFTHIIPYIDGEIFRKGVIRIDVGGKALTNHLKEILSYRQLNVMEETYVINQVKEDTCFMSLDFKSDMRIASSYGAANTISKKYVLPDFNRIRRGYVQDSDDDSSASDTCQVLQMNNERFTVPEVLLRPNTVGINTMGIAESLAHCVRSLPETVRYHRDTLVGNVILTGGNVRFKGFRDRLHKELRALLPAHLPLGVYAPKDPITWSWHGGASFSKSSRFRSGCISRNDYEEFGSNYIFERFNKSGSQFQELEEKVKVKKDEGNSIFSYLNFTESVFSEQTAGDTNTLEGESFPMKEKELATTQDKIIITSEPVITELVSEKISKPETIITSNSNISVTPSTVQISPEIPVIRKHTVEPLQKVEKKVEIMNILNSNMARVQTGKLPKMSFITSNIGLPSTTSSGITTRYILPKNCTNLVCFDSKSKSDVKSSFIDMSNITIRQKQPLMKTYRTTVGSSGSTGSTGSLLMPRLIKYENAKRIMTVIQAGGLRPVTKSISNKETIHVLNTEEHGHGHNNGTRTIRMKNGKLFLE